MTSEQKIIYMRIATNICGFGFKDEHIDLLVRLYEGIIEKGGDMNIRDTAKIEADCKADHTIESVKVEQPTQGV